MNNNYPRVFDDCCPFFFLFLKLLFNDQKIEFASNPYPRVQSNFPSSYEILNILIHSVSTKYFMVINCSFCGNYQWLPSDYRSPCILQKFKSNFTTYSVTVTNSLLPQLMATPDCIWKLWHSTLFFTPTHCLMSSGAHACAKLAAASITPTIVENPHSSPQTRTCLILDVGVFLMCISQFCFVEKS